MSGQFALILAVLEDGKIRFIAITRCATQPSQFKQNRKLPVQDREVAWSAPTRSSVGTKCFIHTSVGFAFVSYMLRIILIISAGFKVFKNRKYHGLIN